MVVQISRVLVLVLSKSCFVGFFYFFIKCLFKIENITDLFILFFLIWGCFTYIKYFLALNHKCMKILSDWTAFY